MQTKQSLYDTFCYPKASDDEWFRESLDLTGAEEKDGLDILGKLKLRLEKTQVCVVYNKENILCKSLKYTDDEIKQRKAQAKKYLSIEARLVKFQNKWKVKEGKLKTSLKEEKKKRKKDKKTAKKRLLQETKKYKKQKALTTRYQKQNRLRQNFINLVMDELQTNWYPLYKQSALVQYHSMYKHLSSNLQQHQYTTSLAGIDFSTEDIITAIEIDMREELPLGEVDLDELYPRLFEQTQETVDTFLYNLQA